MWYILDNDNKPKESTYLEYIGWETLNKDKRIIKQENVGDIFISTVFLGLSYDKIPMLWETMIFGGEHNEYQKRYSTYDDAVKGHQDALNLINN